MYASLYRVRKTVLQSALQTDFLEESMSRFVRFPRRALACGAILAVALLLVGVAGDFIPASLVLNPRFLFNLFISPAFRT